ncbi:alginate O-acetyltransferase AlgX-related protein [Roseobacter sp. MH60115]|uniref:alginate O-acetyltransferase AlgX-related protein n=1 Tax=Roseobacter sp. MH60115 TaxID=2785324 RepID=UPI0018A2AD12|nr:hypothetical protein [Roseobacter sp. MH60115]
MQLYRNIFPQLALPILTSAFVIFSGANAVREADPRGAFRDTFDGLYQRTYEDRFDVAMPFKELALHSWTALRLAAFGEANHGALVGQDGWLFTLEEFGAGEDATDFRAEVSEIRDLLAANGVALIPVIIPDKARVMAAMHRFPRDLALQTRFDGALSVLTELGLPAIDMRKTLSDLGEAAFLRTDTHWSPTGSQAVAQVLAAHLPEIMRRDGVFQTQKVGEALLEGDLTVFAQTGPFQPFVGPMLETIPVFETVSTSSELGLLGDPKIQIALVGTSFSARDDLHFEGFLKSAFGQDILNLAEEGQGPFVPMRRFLASRSLASTSVKTVIWEIPERYINLRTFP